MSPVMTAWERMAELWIKSKGGKREYLDAKELREIDHIMRLNTDYWANMSKLKGLSLLVFETDDIDEQHRICAAVEELEATGKTTYFHELSQRVDRGDRR